MVLSKKLIPYLDLPHTNSLMDINFCSLSEKKIFGI